MKLFTTRLLEEYLNRDKRLFESILPELVKRLIISEASVERIRIPDGSDIWLPGFDGVVESKTETIHVRTGISYWEFGTAKNYISKINSDYKKRTEEIDSKLKNVAAIYFVTPYPWTRKTSISQWELKHNDWAKTRVIDGSELANWINSQPCVAAWLLSKFNESRTDFSTVNDAWRIFVNYSSPELKSSMFLSGRAEAVEMLFSEMSDKEIIRVKADFFYDAIGFVLSAIMSDKSLSEMAIVVNDYETYKVISNITSNQIIILNFFCDKSFVKGNHTVICFGKKALGIKGDIKLIPIKRHQFEYALKDMGIDQEKASELYRKTRGSINAFLRISPGIINLPIPEWTKEKDLHLLYPLLFLESINRNSNKWLVESLSNESYNVIDEKYKALSLLEDSPVRLISDYFQLINYEEVWNVLMPDTEDEAFSRLIKTLMSLNKNKSLYEKLRCRMPIDQQLLANLVWYSYSNNESKTFRKSIVDLLNQRERNKMIYDNLFIFAEADPEDTLDAIERDIEHKDSYIFTAFMNNEYSAILMALEELTTHEATAYRACEILAILARKDYKYSYSNNPLNSLASVLSLINFYSALTVEEKVTLLESYICDDSTVGTQFVANVLGMNGFYRSMRFGRKNSEVFETLSLEKYHDVIRELSLKIVVFCNRCRNIKPVKELIDHYWIFKPEHLSSLSESFNSSNYVDLEVVNLNYDIRRKILYFNKHEEKKEYYDSLIIWENKTSFDDPLLKNAWIFKEYYHCFDDSFNDINPVIYEEKAFEFRKNAIEEILSACGPDKAAQIATHMDNSRGWGTIILCCKDNSFVINTCKVALRQEKYMIVAGCMDAMVYEDFISIFIKCSCQERERLLPLLFRHDILNSLSENELKLYWSNKIMRNYNEEEYCNLLKYNPCGLLYYCSCESENNVEGSINCVTEVFQSIIDIGVNEYSSFLGLVESIIARIDKVYYSQEWAELCLKLQELFEICVNSDGINRYYFENPEKLLKKYKDSMGLYDLFRLPSVAFEDYNRFKGFCRFMLKDNNGFYAAKALSYSFSINGDVPLYILMFLEEYASYDFDKEIASFIDTNSDINIVGNGTDHKKESDRFNHIAKHMEPKYQHGKTVFIELGRINSLRAREEEIYHELI